MTAPPVLPENVNLAALQRAAIGKLGLTRYPIFIRGMTIEDANKGAVPFQVWPYTEQVAQEMDDGEDLLILKARQLGLTWEAAGYAVHHCRKGKHARVIVISQGEFYAEQFLERCKFINAHQIPELRQKVSARGTNKSELNFASGGKIQALPSTENAGRSTQASLVIIDEAAFHPYAAENYKAYRPTMADGGQLIIISTSNGPNGFFWEQWIKNRDQEARGVRSTFKTKFIPAMGPGSRPDRTQEWYERELEAYVGMPQAFRAEYPMTPDEAFSQLSGLVYPNFNAVRHFKLPPVPWEQCIYRFGGMDLGGGDPTAVLNMGVYKDPKDLTMKAHVYSLFYKDDGPATVEEIFKYLSRWDATKRFTVVAGDFAPGGATVSASLANMGLPIKNTMATRKEGIDLVYMFLEKGWLSFSPNPEIERVFRREFSSYRWSDKMDPHSRDKYTTKTPTDHHGDALDALRGSVLLARNYMWTDPTTNGAKSGKIRWAP